MTDNRKCMIDSREAGGNWDSDRASNESFTVTEARRLVAELKADPEWAGNEFRLLVDDDEYGEEIIYL